MACDPQSFQGVTAAQWQTLKAGVQRRFGIAVEGDAGEDGHMGVTIRWNYDRAAQRLTLTVTDRPFFLPCTAINAQIADAVQSVQSPR